MDASDINKVAVVGAGHMGHGIAEVAAVAGYDVALRDVEEEVLDDAVDGIQDSLDRFREKGRIDEDVDDVMSRITTTLDLETAVEDADFVVEAAPERMTLKKELFAEMDEYAPPDAVLASNTSSLSITEMSEATDRPDRVVGTHFFNPPAIMELVEVVYGEHTSDESAETAYGLMEMWGKTPIYVRKDVRGFVVNSVLGPYLNEPAWIVSEGADVRQADAAMTGEGYPMGPFELADMIGIDVSHDVLQEAGQPVPPVMQERVDRDELGRKTGKGYYDYDDGGADYHDNDPGDFDTLRVEAVMVNEAAKLVGDDVATPEEIDVGTRLGLAFPRGTCTRADELGLDRVLDKLRDLHREKGKERYRPADYLEELVEEGRTGRDSGGFHVPVGDGGYQDIKYSLEDGLLEVTLDRPDSLNALNQGIRREVRDLLESVDEDEVRCVTFEGAGEKAFCAGADINEFSGIKPFETTEGTPVYEVVADYPRPTVAKIDGYCLGGGFELALACDLRLATEEAVFGFPEINLGLIPGGGGTQRIMRVVGETRAKEMVFRGNHIDAERAEEWGVVNRAVPREEFDDTVEEFVGDLVGGPPVALRHAKMVMNEGRDASLDAALRMERQSFGALTATEDMREGAAAFTEDREPEFEGK